MIPVPAILATCFLCIVPQIKLKGSLGEEIFCHLKWIYERQGVGRINSERNNERGVCETVS